jgi:hypothetical protein
MGIVLTFLSLFSNFIRTAFTEIQEFIKMPHHKCKTQHWFAFFIYVLKTLHFLMAAPFFFSLGGTET